MNYGNIAQKTNFLCGSDELDFGPLFVQSFAIPGINFSHTDIAGSRHGAKLHIQGDSCTYNNLNLNLLIDEDFKSYFDFYDKVMKGFNPREGKFANQEFNFWITVTDLKGYPLFKTEFFSCRIESIGDIELTTTDDSTANTLSIDIVYDYYTISKIQSK